MAKRRRSRKHNLAIGECKIMTNPRTKKRVKFCRTGKGLTGYQFKKG